MIDPVLERNLTDCRELLELWQRFQQFMATALKEGEGTPSEESEFLHIKSRIAVLHDSFMSALLEDKNIGQSMLTIAGRAITLRHVARMSVAEVKKMEIEWHQAFLLLQETLGNVEEKQTELAAISETAHRVDLLKTNLSQSWRRITRSNTFRGVLIFGGILFGTIGVQLLGIWSWSDLRNYPATRAAFYVTYDKVLRLAIGTLPYYRLDWVERNDKVEPPTGFWFHDIAVVPDLDRECQVNVESEMNRLLPPFVPQSLLEELAQRTDTKQIWFYNERDYICLALFLMRSGAQARRLADDFRGALTGTRAERDFGFTTRSNILITVFFSVKALPNGNQGSRTTFPQFVSQGENLIR